MRAAFHLVLALALAACSSSSITSGPPGLPSPTSSLQPPASSLPTVAPVRTVVLSTPTPAPPPLVVLVSAQSEALDAVVQQAAAESGWDYRLDSPGTPPALEAAAREGALIVVSHGAELAGAALELAGRYPETYFISLPAPEGELPPNLLGLGGPGDRYDQAGLLAGMAAGFASQNRYAVGVGDLEDVIARNYLMGFLHGVRYVCPRCRVEIVNAGGADLARDITVYRAGGADAFFAAPGPAGEEVLRLAAGKGAWVVGSGADVHLTVFGDGSLPEAERLLTSVYLDAGPALAAALAAFRQGAPLPTGAQPLSAANGAVVVAPYREPAGILTPLDQQVMATTLSRLADGSLETGVNPLTGEER